MNNFGLFFTRDGLVIRLPVNPPELPVTKEGNNGDYNVLGLGQIMVPRTPNLRTLEISTHFPGRVSPMTLTPNGFKKPEFYINFFQSAMDDKVPILYTPVRYYENGEPYASGITGFQVLVTSFEYEERGGETGDFYYTLSLSEYRDYSPQLLQIKNTGGKKLKKATPKKTREIPKGELVVGATAIANGNWYYTSYGDEPHGIGNGRRVKISRIVDKSRPRPIHVTTESGGWLGWMAESALQVVSDG